MLHSYMRPSEMFDCVVIAGVGLVGGSIGLGIRQRFLAKKVIGLDQNPKALEAALGMGVIDEAKFNAGRWLAEADLVILASPASTIVSSAESLCPFLSSSCLLTDVGSVKYSITQGMAELGIERFVGGHPMAGSEKGGVQNASAALLENALWVITPSSATRATDLEQIQSFVRALGASPIGIDAQKHDKLVAAISHLPYVMATALTQLIARDEDQEHMMMLAAGGFRDVTRVASGSPRMSRDMVVGNKAELRRIIMTMQEELGRISSLLDDPEHLLSFAEQSKQIRDSIPIVRRSLLPSQHELNVAVPDVPGQLARITTALGEANINIKDIEVLDIREHGGALRLNFEDDVNVDKAKGVLEGLAYEVRRTG